MNDSKLTLNGFTNGFDGCTSSIGAKVPRRVQWVYFQNPFDGVSVFEDGHMFETDPRTVQTAARIGWLQEPRALRPENYTRAWDARAQFDAIMTYDAELLRADPSKFQLCVRGGVHLPGAQWGTVTKSKRAAMLTTNKQVTPGHHLRRTIAERFAARVDVFGAGARVDKSVLAAYRYVVVVESERTENFFTEHLLDALALHCVPLYWGAPNIGEFLNADGMLPFASLEELDERLDDIERDERGRYASMVAARLDNLKRLADYEIPEDWMVTHTNWFRTAGTGEMKSC